MPRAWRLPKRCWSGAGLRLPRHLRRLHAVGDRLASGLSEIMTPIGSASRRAKRGPMVSLFLTNGKSGQVHGISRRPPALRLREVHRACSTRCSGGASTSIPISLRRCFSQPRTRPPTSTACWIALRTGPDRVYCSDQLLVACLAGNLERGADSGSGGGLPRHDFRPGSGAADRSCATGRERRPWRRRWPRKGSTRATEWLWPSATARDSSPCGRPSWPAGARRCCCTRKRRSRRSNAS